MPQVSAAGPTIGLPPGDEVRILAGSPRSYVDHAGKLWNADTWFSGGAAVRSDVRHIGRTQDPSFYRTSRQGDFHYDIPLRPGVYELHLHFAETLYGPENSGMGGEGSRLFSVRANGKPLLTRFDILADAGGGDTADDRVFTDLAPARDGRLHLEFAGEDGKDAAVSAIEILPGVRGRIRPIRLLARQTPYYSNDSQWWSPDNYFEGGQIASYADPVAGTDDPELYETERWGNFSYAIPAAPGRYTVRLHFAARHRGWNQPPSAAKKAAAPVEHLFSVFCNGKAILENFDLPHEATTPTSSCAPLRPGAERPGQAPAQLRPGERLRLDHRHRSPAGITSACHRSSRAPPVREPTSEREARPELELPRRIHRAGDLPKRRRLIGLRLHGGDRWHPRHSKLWRVGQVVGRNLQPQVPALAHRECLVERKIQVPRPHGPHMIQIGGSRAWHERTGWQGEAVRREPPRQGYAELLCPDRRSGSVAD